MTYLPICIRVIFYFMKRVNSSWNAVLELLNSSVIEWKGHYIAFVLLKWFLGPSINYKFNKSIYCLFVWIYGFVMIKNRLKLPFVWSKSIYMHLFFFCFLSLFVIYGTVLVWLFMSFVILMSIMPFACRVKRKRNQNVAHTVPRGSNVANI